MPPPSILKDPPAGQQKLIHISILLRTIWITFPQRKGQALESKPHLIGLRRSIWDAVLSTTMQLSSLEAGSRRKWMRSALPPSPFSSQDYCRSCVAIISANLSHRRGPAGLSRNIPYAKGTIEIGSKAWVCLCRRQPSPHTTPLAINGGCMCRNARIPSHP